jgi:cytochrome P450
LDDLDLTDPRWFAIGFPHELFARLRDVAPVWRHPPTAGVAEGFWVLTRHADCSAAATDVRMQASHRAGRAALDGMADARYQGLRRLLGPALSASAMRGIEDEVRWTAERLVRAAARRRHVDFVTDVATALSFDTVARVLGVPDKDRRKLLEWVTFVVDEDAHAAAAEEAILSYGQKLIGQKRSHPGADLLSKAIHASIELTDVEHDRLDQTEVLKLFDLLVAAGIDTTRDAIAAGILALAQHPEQWRALQQDRSKLRRATEEILRWASPTPSDQRIAMSDMDIGEHKIRAGERATLWWASANRDEAVFADPSRFDVHRDPNPHLAFGHGPHSCFAATLARLEIRLLLDVLLDHVSGLAVASSPEWVCNNEHSSLRRLPVRLTAR